jgi:hypothetical protein
MCGHGGDPASTSEGSILEHGRKAIYKEPWSPSGLMNQSFLNSLSPLAYGMKKKSTST